MATTERIDSFEISLYPETFTLDQAIEATTDPELIQRTLAEIEKFSKLSPVAISTKAERDQLRKYAANFKRMSAALKKKKSSLNKEIKVRNKQELDAINESVSKLITAADQAGTQCRFPLTEYEEKLQRQKEIEQERMDLFQENEDLIFQSESVEQLNKLADYFKSCNPEDFGSQKEMVQNSCKSRYNRCMERIKYVEEKSLLKEKERELAEKEKALKQAMEELNPTAKVEKSEPAIEQKPESTPNEETLSDPSVESPPVLLEKDGESINILLKIEGKQSNIKVPLPLAEKLRDGLVQILK